MPMPDGNGEREGEEGGVGFHSPVSVLGAMVFSYRRVEGYVWDTET